MTRISLFAACLLFIAFPAFGQASARRSDSLTNMLATVNPVVVATGQKVTYEVMGYNAFEDWGQSRQFSLTTNIAGLTTNLAHIFQSPLATNWYWISSDQENGNQDPRWWGAFANSTNNSVTNIQHALDYSDPHARRLWLPPGTYFTISKPIKFDTGLVGADDYMSVELIGNGSKLVCTAPTNIIQLEAQSIFYGKIEDVVFTYDQAYTNDTANVISLRGDPTGPGYYNVYNVSFNNLTFLRGYYAIKQEEWCSPWGNKYTQWFVSQELAGGAVDFAPASNFGNVNNVFESIYVRADMMAGPVFKIKNQNLLAMKDIEINVLHDKQAMLLTASSSVNIQNWRMEVGSFNNSYDGLFQFANVTQLLWDNLQIQSFDLDAPAGTWNYIIRDVGSGPAVNTSSLQFNNLFLKNVTKTNAASYLAMIYSPYQRYSLKTWDSDATLANTYVSYPFGGPSTNVTAQSWHRNITDLPTIPGEFAFDTNNWPYISTGISSVTNWLRLGNADVFGPASSTDNAVVRFDGTTGKLLQNSLLTLDDSGNINTPGQLHVFGPGYGNPIIRLDGKKGEGGDVSGVRAIDILSAGTLRWRIGGNSTTETNIDNSGSDFELQAYNSNGVYLYTVWRGVRNTGTLQTYGDVSIGGVGSATAPTVGEVTGSPEGSKTANPGSIRLDKNGYAWLKQTGTGNTGWRLLSPSVVANGTSTITNVAQGTGILITSAAETATIGLSNTAVTPGSYTTANITVDAQGRITAASNGSAGTTYTNFWPDLTNALKNGANVSFAYDTTNETLTISATSGTSATNGTPVSVNAGGVLSEANLVSTVGILVNASGSNVTWQIQDRDFGDITVTDSGETFVIDNGAVTTNKIDATFYNWVESQGGGAGAVYADGTLTTNLKSSPSIRLTTTGSETTLALSNTTVTAGSYTLASITVDAQGRITAAGSGTAGTNAGATVYIDGAQQSSFNITNSADIDPSLSGTNLSFVVVESSLATNKINSVFYNWINGKGGLADNNTWTGTNTFTDLFSDELYINTLIVTNPIPVSSGGTGTNTFPLYSILYGNTTNPVGNVASVADRIVGWNGSGVPVAYSAGSGITISGGQISSTATGGGGLGTNLFVNNVLKQPAKLTNSASVTWNTNLNGDIYATSISVTNSPVSSLWQRWGYANVIITNNNTLGDIQSSSVGGYISSVSVVGSGANTAPLVLELTFSQARDTNYLVVCEFESSTAEYAIEYWVEKGNRGTGSVRVSFTSSGLSVFATPGNWMRVNVIEPNATAGGMGGDVITTSNNVLTGLNQFTNLLTVRGGLELTNYYLRVTGPSSGGRIFPSGGKGIEFLYDATNWIDSAGSFGRGELQVYDSSGAAFGDFRFNARNMGVYSSNTLVTLFTNGRVQVTGNLFVNGSNVMSAIDGKLSATGDAGGLTLANQATNANQLVNLAQLQSAVSGGIVSHFDVSTPATGFTLTGTVGSTNRNTLVAPSTSTTNTGTSLTTGNYVAAFITTNTYSSIASGLANIEFYAFESAPGSPQISAEVYVVNSVTKAEEKEFTPGPAYQTVAAGTTPTLMSFSVPITDYSSTTNFHIMVKLKQNNSGTVQLVTGGSYDGHIAFSIPSQNLVLKSGDTMTGALSNTVSIGSPTLFAGTTNVASSLAGKAPSASPVMTNPQLTNGVTFGQSTLSAHSAGTNFVVDPTINQYQLITVNNTNAVRFLHLTNGAPGRQTVVLINVQTNTTVSVALDANQFASTTNLMSLTQGQILPLSFYCYGSNNTNVVVSVPTLPFIHR